MDKQLLKPFFHLRGTLYTLGYAHPDATDHLSNLMNQEHIVLLDIRYSPYSRWYPTWTRYALASTYGERYRWEQRLGNLNYRERESGIKLAEGHREAIQEAASLLSQGTSLVLLCACKDARTCHRSLVAKLIQDALDRIQEEVLP